MTIIMIRIQQQINDNKITYSFLQSARQIDHRNIGNRNTESHSSELSIESRDDFADGFGRSSGRRDDVGAGRASATPVLARRSVDGLLRGGERVNGRHQTLNDDEVIVDDLGQRRQAVGRA